MTQKGEITILTHASTKGSSLRTTVPISILRQFNLEGGDQLRWEMKAENNKLVLVVRPVKTSKEQTGKGKTG